MAPTARLDPNGVFALVVTGVLALPVPAPSQVDATCTFNEGTHTVTVTVQEIGVSARLINPNGEVRLDGQDCGTATMTNTDTVVINDPTYSSIFLTVTPAGGPWAPGFTDEPGSSDEIEFTVNAGSDTIVWDATESQGALDLVLGTNQVNLNASEVDGIDADLAFDGGVDRFWVKGSRFNDSVSGSGGAGTPTASTDVNILFEGRSGRDRLLGGTRLDEFYGSTGNDVFVGREGGDVVLDDRGNDVIRGGKGRDVLASGGGKDFIAGGPDRDTIEGMGGGDLIRGQGASDRLMGSAGDDRLDGGSGNDHCNGGPGTDALKSCERE